MASTGERVLVVESDPVISDLIARQALKPLGYDVKVVSEAAQAIEEALENPPDLIIANLDLRDLGGKDVLAAISSQGVTAPVVVIAGKGEERRAIQAFRLGAADALLWPAKDAEIVRVVERSMQPTRSQRIRRQLYQQLEAAEEELKRRAGDLAAILSMGKALSSSTDQRQLFGRLLESAMQIAHADVAWFTVRDDRTRNYLLRAHRNLPPAWAGKLNQPLDDGLSSLVSISGQALAIHGQPIEKFKVAALGKSAAVLPVKVRDAVLGVLLVIRKADVEIDKDVQELLQALADFASISLLNTRLFKALEAAAAATRLNERNLARLLESLQVSIDGLKSLRSGDEGELTKEQKEAVTAVQAALECLARSAGTPGAAASPPAD
ncbi:MAG: response regulator [Chloroflexota bacterium]